MNEEDNEWLKGKMNQWCYWANDELMSGWMTK